MKAAIEKFGLKDVQAAMSKKELMELFSFGGLVHSAEHDVSKVAHDVEPIAKYAAGKAWMGTKACYANASCKASVEKVGIAATEAAFA